MHIMRFDVIIVGASLSGLNTAYHLKENHPEVKVLVIDKRAEIGKPVRCGEGTFLDSLEHCGVDYDHLKFSLWFDSGEWLGKSEKYNIIANRIKYLKLIYPDLKMSFIELHHFHPVILNRDKFEEYLFDRMPITNDLSTPNSAKWVYLLMNTTLKDMKWSESRQTWKLITNRNTSPNISCCQTGGKKRISYEICKDEPETEFYTRTVIGADGMNSKVAKCSGLKTKYQPNQYFKCIQQTIKLSKIQLLRKTQKHTMTLVFDPDIIPHGYGWIFPKAYDEVNCGLGVLASQKLNLKHALKTFRFRYVDDYGSDFINEFYANVPTTLPSHYLDRHRNVFLVGDAGDFVLSSFGGGIATSLWTGMMTGKYYDDPLKLNNIIQTELIPKLESANELKVKLYDQDIEKTKKYLNKMRWLIKFHKLFPTLLEMYGGKNLISKL